MALKWYVKRLAAMSGREIVHRVGEQVRRSISRHRHYGWEHFPPVGRATPVAGLAERLTAGASDDFKAAVRVSVDVILDGRFEVHGIRWPRQSPDNLFPPDLWRLDPISGQLWSGADVFCFDTDYRHKEQAGDIKFVWDINRLQVLQPLAAAVALWGDQRALLAIQDALRSWCVANPPFVGVAWNSGVELALRVVTLLLVVSLCGARLDAETQDWIPRILAAHLYWLRRFPSRFSSANNHLISEALAEFSIANVLPQLSDARTVAREARATLEREARLQFFTDGVPGEQSPTYGAFAAEMLLVADLIASASHDAMSPAYAKRLIAYADFVGALSDGKGRVPNIGDDDEVRIVTLRGGVEQAYPGAIARAIAAHYAVATSVPLSADGPELREALFGRAEPSPIVPDGLRVFREGGYTVVRQSAGGRRVRLVLDHGPLGYLSIAAHGHADANAFTLSLDDDDIVVDPGTYQYHPGGTWRDWFRGTGAHSTLRLGGVDQSLIAGSFNWSHKAVARLENAEDGAEGWSITARHDGYVKRFGVEHQRRVASCADGFLVEDKLLGGVTKAVSEVIFQFTPSFYLDEKDGCWIVSRHSKSVATLCFSSEGTVTALSGGLLPGDGGWVSRRFGSKVEAVRLVWSGILPVEGLRTTWTWSKTSTPGSVEPDDNAAMITIQA